MLSGGTVDGTTTIDLICMDSEGYLCTSEYPFVEVIASEELESQFSGSLFLTGFSDPDINFLSSLAAEGAIDREMMTLHYDFVNSSSSFVDFGSFGSEQGGWEYVNMEPEYDFGCKIGYYGWNLRLYGSDSATPFYNH